MRKRTNRKQVRSSTSHQYLSPIIRLAVQSALDWPELAVRDYQEARRFTMERARADFQAGDRYAIADALRRDAWLAAKLN